MKQGKNRTTNQEIELFLTQYSNEIFNQVIELREILIRLLPGVTEQLDLPAKMIAYAYGQKYTDLVCVLIPSKKGLKLGFNKGTGLYDPEGWLQGKGKISRYVEITSDEQLHSDVLKNLVLNALVLYRERSGSQW